MNKNVSKRSTGDIICKLIVDVWAIIIIALIILKWVTIFTS